MQPLERDESSKLCFDELKNNGLIKPNYNRWATKEKGYQQGLILFGITKTYTPKKMFVKSYENDRYGRSLTNAAINGNSLFDELNDFAAYYILKKCGVRAPKFKLKAAHNAVYAFSTDIAQHNKKYPQKNYAYYDMSDLPYTIDVQNAKLIPKPYCLTNDIIPIDVNSIIRFALMATIMNLIDLNTTNVGYVISDDGQRRIAKLATIDINFYLPEELKRYGSLGELVVNELDNNLGSNYIKFEMYSPLVTSSACRDAFIKIENNFLQACDEVEKHITNDMPFESQANKMKTLALIGVWRDKFRAIRELASIPANSHIQPCVI